MADSDNKNNIITYLSIGLGVIFMMYTLSLFSKFSEKKDQHTVNPNDTTGQNPLVDPSSHSSIGDYEKVLNQTAIELNKTCPIMIDMETRLDNVMAFILNNEFQYNYSLINTQKSMIDVQTLENTMRPQILSTMKQSIELDVFRENNTTLIYHYRDMNGEPLFKLVFPSTEYTP